MIAKRIRRGRRAARGSVRKLHRFITALTRYLVNAEAADLVEIETGRRLTEYILDANGTTNLEALGVEPGEKVEYSGARNLIGNALASWQAQMLATAAGATRCRDPIEHYVLSWQTGEEPSKQQFARAVEIAVSELGLSECQAVWAVHGNTDNLHAHIAVNRVHPISGKTLSAGDGWDKDRLQQICALIEHEGGWCAEKNALYTVRDGQVVHRETDTVVRNRDGRQTRARDRASEPLQIPPGFESIVEAIAAASGWRDLHDRLNRLGARYERAGPGANVVRGETRIKPSKLGRTCSLPTLEKQFGSFEPSPHLDGYARYKAHTNAERDRLRAAKGAAIVAVENWYASQASGLADVGAGSDIISLLLADLGARKAGILASIDAAFANAESALGAMKSERSWITAGKPEPGVAAVPAILMPSLASRVQDKPSASDVLTKLIKHVNAATGLIEYRDDKGAVVMVDAGGVIIVRRVERDGLEAGLLLAAGRWSEVKFTGDARTAEIVTELARLHRIRVVDAHGRIMRPTDPVAQGSRKSGAGQRTPGSASSPAHASVSTRVRDTSIRGESASFPADPTVPKPDAPTIVEEDRPDLIGYGSRKQRGSGR